MQTKVQTYVVQFCFINEVSAVSSDVKQVDISRMPFQKVWFLNVQLMPPYEMTSVKQSRHEVRKIWEKEK